ncbi:hypothetical protein QVD17_33520 [Tagetes erecta]|uniref:Uncharacterized protein n=1 Tax=Tagetes erecta TaxID=13708 RepID=A0AAD8K112_TARER|nr:hypothetical protein QVD17_33520 [Tagetes erecta]
MNGTNPSIAWALGFGHKHVAPAYGSLTSVMKASMKGRYTCQKGLKLGRGYRVKMRQVNKQGHGELEVLRVSLLRNEECLKIELGLGLYGVVVM